MEENFQPQETPRTSTFILPPHKNRMVMSILCTLLCCQLGGIIAIVYSSKSNSAYNSALICVDDTSKSNLYYQSEQYNKTAKTWIIVSLITGIVAIVLYIIAMAAGTLSAYL